MAAQPWIKPKPKFSVGNLFLKDAPSSGDERRVLSPVGITPRHLSATRYRSKLYKI